MKTVVKLTLLYSVCFVSVALLIVYGYTVGFLSPRGFGVALGLLIGVSFLTGAFGIAMFGRKRATLSLDGAPGAPLDPAIRKQRVFAIQVWKLVIALLVLGLVSGLSRAARDFPLWETLVLVAMNLVVTISLIRLVVRLQRSLQ